MLTQEAKDLFNKLDFEIQPVALKYCFSQPEDFERVDEVLSFCQFCKKAAVEDRGFFITVDDDNCFGKMVMGMSREEAADAACSEIQRMSAELGIPQHLSELGITEADIPELAEQAIADVCTPGNPREVTKQDIINMYKEIL